MGAVVLASLFAAPAAEAVSWLEALRREEPRAELGWGAGLRTIWQHFNRLLMADGDNRASLDPNG
ncbi:MAG TPA: hypothetical protein VE078_00380 [Thermoanaerobaculia bacterium]|nr:hypothetical protein [Thermoanaerobaculia bacterium]